MVQARFQCVCSIFTALKALTNLFNNLLYLHSTLKSAIRARGCTAMATSKSADKVHLHSNSKSMQYPKAVEHEATSWSSSKRQECCRFLQSPEPGNVLRARKAMYFYGTCLGAPHFCPFPHQSAISQGSLERSKSSHIRFSSWLPTRAAVQLGWHITHRMSEVGYGLALPGTSGMEGWPSKKTAEKTTRPVQHLGTMTRLAHNLISQREDSSPTAACLATREEP